MNNTKNKANAGPEVSWICCPECGKKNRRSALACDVCRCETCGKDFRAYVVKGTVMVIPLKKEENEVETYYRTRNYMEQLVNLLNAQ